MNDLGKVTITITSSDGIASFGGVEVLVLEGVAPYNIRAAIMDAIYQQKLGTIGKVFN